MTLPKDFVVEQGSLPSAAGVYRDAAARGRSIRRRARHRAVPLFMLMWAIVAVVFCLAILGRGVTHFGPGTALLIVIACASVVLSYVALAALLNETIVRVDDRYVVFREGPLPMAAPRRWVRSQSDLVEVRVATTGNLLAGVPAYPPSKAFNVVLARRSEEFVVFERLSTEAEARAVQAVIASMLT